MDEKQPSTMDRDSPVFRVVSAMNAIRSELGIGGRSFDEYLDDHLLAQPMADMIGDLSRELFEARAELVLLRRENKYMHDLLSKCRGPNAELKHFAVKKGLRS